MKFNLSPVLTAGIAGLAVVAVAGLSLVGLNQYLTVEAAKAQHQAVAECFNSARVESLRVEEDGRELRITEPVREIYSYCLQDKGLSVTEIQ